MQTQSVISLPLASFANALLVTLNGLEEDVKAAIMLALLPAMTADHDKRGDTGTFFLPSLLATTKEKIP
jgi:hypothetical protein